MDPIAFFPLSAGGAEKFSMLAKKGDLHFLVGRGGPENFLIVILNC